MSEKIKPYLLTVPAMPLNFQLPAKIKKWHIIAGQEIKAGEVLVTLTDGFPGEEEATQTLYAPTDAVLESIKIYANEPSPTGAVAGILRVAEDYKDTAARDWNNFDLLSEILSEFTEKTKDAKQLRDINDALSELFGVKEDAVFQKMNTEQQNQFIQSVTDQYKNYGLSPATMAQKLLEGLQLRPPQLAPATPTPAYGLRPSAPGLSAPGLGGGTKPASPQIAPIPPTATE